MTLRYYGMFDHFGASVFTVYLAASEGEDEVALSFYYPF